MCLQTIDPNVPPADPVRPPSLVLASAAPMNRAREVLALVFASPKAHDTG